MKKYIITILALCLVQLSFAQSIKSIRVNNSIRGKSWSYAISEIDSITYDSFSQLQKLYTNGVCEEAILESVDSISFSSDEPINVVLSKDYINDVKSYIFSNGIVLTEKEDSLQGKIIMLDSLDVVQNQWSDDKSFMIYCDSTYKPFFAKNSQNIFYFGYDENRNLIEINATDLDGNIISPMKANARKNAILRVSTEGWTTGDDIGAALDLYGTVNTMYNPNRGNIAGTVTSWLAKLLPQGIPQDLVGLTPSLIEALNGGKAGLLGAILGYKKLIQHIGENRARSLIGDCTPYIKSACKEGNNSAVINVQIAGVSSNTQCTPYYQIRYWQEVDGERTNVTYTTTPVKATNGTHPITIGNLHGGRYGFQVLIFPDLFLGYDNLIGLYNFRSNVAYVDIAPLHFKVLEQDYTTYADDCVTVSMKAVIDFPSEQDETILSYYDSYGVYVHYNNNVNQREDYYSVKENGSNEFYITLDIPRDEFSCDYSNFIATCSDKITFKAYTIDGWGIKEFYDEQGPKIVYDQEPGLIFTSASMGGVSTQTFQDDEGNEYLYYSVPYWFDFDVEGAFWIDYVQYTIYGDGWTYNGGNPIIVCDGSYSYESSMGYFQGSDLNSVDFYTITLTNGSTMRSSNSMIFGGADANPTISVGGAPNFARQRQSISVKSQNSTDKRLNTKTGIGISGSLRKHPSRRICPIRR